MEPFKNWLNFNAAKNIASQIAAVNRKFAPQNFLRGLAKELEPLSLKQRMELLTYRLSRELPQSPEAFAYLIAALKHEKNPNGLSGFQVWPLTHYVSQFGLDHFSESMHALKEMTKVFTGEFAVRPFFIKYEKSTLDLFLNWTADPNEHVRRLVSEGSRPFLPWGTKLQNFSDHPHLTWPLLQALQNDSAPYVQKSVANHINDLSKFNADWITKNISNWENAWIKKHGLRTLIKKGHPQALSLIGIKATAFKISELKLNKKNIHLGENLTIHFYLQNLSKQTNKFVIDINLDLLRKNKKYNAKVFKGKNISITPHNKEFISLNIKLKKVTTRSYYSGKHFISLLINGRLSQKIEFILKV